jgi:transketolase
MMSDSAFLKQEANAIRCSILRMCHKAKASHVGSGLSCADILTVLYIGKVMNVNPKKPLAPERDYFILSKGHASAALYATLAKAGFFPISDLDSYYKDGSSMPGHPVRGCMPGIEVSTGSLGHGLGLGAGMAMALKSDDKPNRVFVLLSDG